MTPKSALTPSQENAQDLPRTAVIHHDFDRGSRLNIGRHLLHGPLRPWCVMNHAKGVDQIVRLDGKRGGQLFRVRVIKFDSIRQAKEPGALARDLERARRKIHGGNPSSLTGEIDCVCPDSTSDLQHFFSPPELELGKSRNMRLNKILAFFDLIKIATRSDFLC